MALYWYQAGSKLVEIDPATYARWVEIGNAKAQAYSPVPAQPHPQARYDGTEWVLPPLDQLKAQRIAQINYEANQRIESVWPLWAQSNAALGVYPESDAIACRQWIEQHIDASNTATARVNAATSAAEIDAVVVAWPEAAA
jgi:hypothetical protein